MNEIKILYVLFFRISSLAKFNCRLIFKNKNKRIFLEEIDYILRNCNKRVMLGKTYYKVNPENLYIKFSNRNIKKKYLI